jgi:hypothetical protein
MGNEVVGGDLGRLESIPSTGLVLETRRISWWPWIDDGTTGVVGAGKEALGNSQRGKKNGRRREGRRGEEMARVCVVLR